MIHCVYYLFVIVELYSYNFQIKSNLFASTKYKRKTVEKTQG